MKILGSQPLLLVPKLHTQHRLLIRNTAQCSVVRLVEIYRNLEI